MQPPPRPLDPVAQESPCACDETEESCTSGSRSNITISGLHQRLAAIIQWAISESWASTAPGVETYQITLGGDHTETAAIGERTGPGFAYDEIVPAIERIIRAYLSLRETPDEIFLDTYRRAGAAPFKAALYEAGDARADAA